jgi:hypothetical protein
LKKKRGGQSFTVVSKQMISTKLFVFANKLAIIQHQLEQTTAKYSASIRASNYLSQLRTDTIYYTLKRLTKLNFSFGNSYRKHYFIL